MRPRQEVKNTVKRYCELFLPFAAVPALGAYVLTAASLAQAGVRWFLAQVQGGESNTVQ